MPPSAPTNSPPSSQRPGAARPTPMPRAVHRFVWGFGVVMVLTAGTGFLIKLVEFSYGFTRSPQTIIGFVPVLTYLIVAAGFACLFFWAYLTGQFKNIEAPKYRMLQMQDEFDEKEKSAKQMPRRNKHPQAGPESSKVRTASDPE